MPVEIGISQIIERKKGKRKYRKGKSNRFKKTDGYDKSDRSDKNLVGQDGSCRSCELRCFRCDSTRNLTSKCPYRANQYKQSDINKVHITLFASAPDQKQCCLIGESLSREVLDTVCIKTVSGENFGWRNT